MRKSYWLMFVAGLVLAGPAHAAQGTISADPNPCKIEAGKRHCTTYLTWSVEGTSAARVMVEAEGRKGAREREFANGTGQSRTPADWIAEGTTYKFTLYDWSSGKKGAALGSVTVTSAK